MRNKPLMMAAGFLIILPILNGCARAPKPNKPEGIFRVDVRSENNEKEIYIGVATYVGQPTPHGWVGWDYRIYSIICPLGKRGCIVNPIVKGAKSLETFGYINFNSVENKVDIHMWDIRYSSYGKNGEILSLDQMRVEKVNELGCNGEFVTNVEDVFK